MRILFSLLISLFVILPFATAANAEEGNIDKNSLLEVIKDFEQAPPEQNLERAAKVNMAAARSLFTDVPSGYWAVNEIHFLYNQSIIQGYETGGTATFRPEQNVTRAQAAKMLVKALGKSELQVAKPTFKDVGTGHWAQGWVERAVEMGLFTGYDDRTFRPDEPLKRSQMGKVIALAFNLPLDSSKENMQVFSDVNRSHWAHRYILKLYYNGISNGNQNRFMPEQYISRSQFSAFLARALSDEFRLPVVEDQVIATGTVTADVLNVRAKPNTNSNILGKLVRGNVVNIYEIQGDWARINYNNAIAYVHKSYLKLSTATGSVLQNRIIAVDAGHGGTDPGAIGQNAYEKTIVLSVAQKLKAKLQAAGANVVMTRDNDTFVSLEERVQIAKRNNAELFISIHVNSASSNKANGTETYYDTSKNPKGYESYLLAKEIQSQIVNNAKMYDRGVKDNNFYVIRNNNVPSVLIELGFISNEGDASKLVSNTYQDIFAESIYRGIVQYYSR